VPEDEAARRLRVAGPNAARTHRVHALSVLARQLRSPLLVLLAVTALASAFVGQASDAVIIGTILLASAGLGFVNEYKAAKTAEALHSSIRHRCVALRGGHPRTVDVTELVPGDVICSSARWFGVTNISGNTVTPIGQMRTEAQRNAVVRAAWRGHAVMAVVDQIEITG
jgi:magnesium-transporting ATPase (P-type)